MLRHVSALGDSGVPHIVPVQVLTRPQWKQAKDAFEALVKKDGVGKIVIEVGDESV